MKKWKLTRYWKKINVLEIEYESVGRDTFISDNNSHIHKMLLLIRIKINETINKSMKGFQLSSRGYYVAVGESRLLMTITKWDLGQTPLRVISDIHSLMHASGCTVVKMDFENIFKRIFIEIWPLLAISCCFKINYRGVFCSRWSLRNPQKLLTRTQC